MPEDIDDFLEAGAKEHIDKARKFIKENWTKKGDQVKPLLTTIQELLDQVDEYKAQIETIIASGKVTEAKAKDGLKTFYGETRLARIWEAEGDLMPTWLRETLLNLGQGHAPLPGGQGEEQPPGPAPARRQPQNHPRQQAREAARRESAPLPGRHNSQQKPPAPATPAARLAVGNGSTASAQNGSLSIPPPTTTTKRPATRPATNTNSEPQRRSKKPRKSGIPDEQLANEPPPDMGKWVSKKDVEGKHWTFKFPSLGPEFYVLLCNPDPAKAHRFTEDPIRRHAAVRHFAMSARDAPCHRDVQGLPAHMSELGIMQRYGYQVDFMTLEDSINSNNEITVKQVEKQAESARAAAAPKGRRRRSDD